MQRRGATLEPAVTATAAVTGDGRIAIHSPLVGVWRSAPVAGAVVVPGGDIGAIEALGVLHRLAAPADAGGAVVETPATGDGPARIAVEHGQRLLVLDPTAATGAAGLVSASRTHAPAAGLVFRSPMSGRYYSRPAPDRPPFVAVGDMVEAGQTVCLLEVMKTFNRVAYGGEGLPELARVVAIAPGDDDDIAAGDPILELEPA